jgi:glycine cleavage system H protein
MKLYSFPDELYYTSNHHWILVDDNLLTIGITAPVAATLGEILYLDLLEQGDRVNKDQTFGTAESIREVFDLISPISGLIVEVNAAVLDEPFLINDDPFGDGWILRVEMEDEREMMAFIRFDAYQNQFADRDSLKLVE